MKRPDVEARLNATDVQAETQKTLVAQIQVEIKGILTDVEIIVLVVRGQQANDPGKENRLSSYV